MNMSEMSSSLPINLRDIDLRKLLIALAGCYFVAIAGAAITTEAVQSWYPTLEKPGFTPPNWVFGPVWTILYTVIAVSAYIVWTHGIENRDVKLGLALFWLQLVLNLLWNFAFFTSRSPSAGLVAIIVLWLSIVATIWKFSKVSKKATLLLVPYILWVSFAGFLNFQIWMLN